MEILIREVEKRSILWNQNHLQKKDRKSAENEWDMVAKMCGTSKEIAKKKWRGLRDQFVKELKKIPKSKSSASQDLTAIYPGKWQYFERLLFLKDIIIPKETDGNVSVKFEDSFDANDTDEVFNAEVFAENTLATEEYNEGTNVEGVAENTTAAEEDNEMTNAEENYIQHSFVEAHLSPKPSPARRKKKRILPHGNNVNHRLLDIESKKLALLEASEDENSLFLRSLTPYMRALDPIRQLRVRNKIQNILLQEMEAAQNQQMYASFPEVSERTNDYSEPTTAFTVVELNDTP